MTEDYITTYHRDHKDIFEKLAPVNPQVAKLKKMLEDYET